MKMLALVLVLLLGVVSAPTKSMALPLPANAEKAMNLGATRGPGVMLGYQVISNKVQLLKCQYDFAVQGGSSASAIKLKAVDGSDCLLPNKSIVLHALLDVITHPAAPYATNIALGTGKAVNDLKTVATTSAYDVGVMALIPVGTAATAIKMTANANPIMTLTGSGPITSGKFNVFLQYLLSE